MNIKGPQILNSQGFTLVEVMVSSLLLTIALVGVTYSVVQNAQSQAGIQLQSQGRQAMREVLSRVQSQPERFPNIQNENSNNFYYVGCFTEAGQQQVVTGASVADFVALPSGGNTNFSQPFPAYNGSGSACASSLGANIEVHVRHTPAPGFPTAGATSSATQPDSIEVLGLLLAISSTSSGQNPSTNSYGLRSLAGGTTDSRQFKASTNSFDSSIFEAFPLSAPSSAPTYAPAITPP